LDINEMRLNKKIRQFLAHSRKKFFFFMGERAYKSNRMEKAEKYFLTSLRHGGDTVECFFFLGCASLRHGDYLRAAERFKKAFYKNPNTILYNDIPFEELLLVSGQLHTSDVMQYHHTRDYSMTSNGLPSSCCSVRALQLGDGSRNRSDQRFEKLPPISAQDIKNVDLDELLKALIGKSV
jgi:hypothetical protein